jgi:preprotein translocase subunit SecA
VCRPGRGYGQHDPLVEYKRESLETFRNMENSILHNAANMLYNSLESAVVNSGANSQTTSSQITVQAKAFTAEPEIDLQKIKNSGIKLDEINRNDMCPCGSGKKYKKCHGK